VQKRGKVDLEAFRRECRERGLRITPQRIAVFETVAGLGSHPSAEEVYRRVSERIPNISFDTVHRTLRTFAELGIIEFVETVSGIKRYDPVTEQHHHLHCIRCGKILDFFHTDFDDLRIPAIVKKDFQVLRSRVSVSGICGECREKTGS
jgi:Fur family peroxide stress response transcriptional regulator